VRVEKSLDRACAVRNAAYGDQRPPMPDHVLAEFEHEYAQLADEIPDSPTKHAISVLHGMVMEVWRALQRERGGNGAGPSDSGALFDLRDLFHTAPPMDQRAVTTPLEPGVEAPDFALPDRTGTLVRLTDFRGRPVVLVFYPLDWSPGCSQQLDLYEQELAEFRERGTEILGISVDSVYSHGAWAALRGISFPLLADFHPKGDVIRRYSVWREQDGYSDRALYVIDADGVIRYSTVAPYLDYVPDLDELLQAVDQAQGIPA
jgi:peroxiredoxin